MQTTPVLQGPIKTKKCTSTGLAKASFSRKEAQRGGSGAATGFGGVPLHPGSPAPSEGLHEGCGAGSGRVPGGHQCSYRNGGVLVATESAGRSKAVVAVRRCFELVLLHHCTWVFFLKAALTAYEEKALVWGSQTLLTSEQ